jgi:tyrosyl-tRNA synthetase
MIGDPIRKSAELNLWPKRHCVTISMYQESACKFLDSSRMTNRAELVTITLYERLHYSTILSRSSNHITVNFMAKDSVNVVWMWSADGMSFTEFTYNCFKIDFLHLYETKVVNSNGWFRPWGNITTGAELIRRTMGRGISRWSCPLITKADGLSLVKQNRISVWTLAKLHHTCSISSVWM